MLREKGYIAAIRICWRYFIRSANGYHTTDGIYFCCLMCYFDLYLMQIGGNL